jgi:hypothetical protein
MWVYIVITIPSIYRYGSMWYCHYVHEVYNEVPVPVLLLGELASKIILLAHFVAVHNAQDVSQPF